MIKVRKKPNQISFKTLSFEFLEPLNDSLLWSPPLDTNQEENSTLVNKYLKQAAKERMSSNKIEMLFFLHHFLIDRTADQEIVLEIFLSTNYNIDQALEKLRLPTTNKNYCIIQLKLKS
jgi:hypothetical protein